jgi:glycosyltransferase involved in cell wall biosynthesis
MKHRICVDDRWVSAHGISRYSTELISRIEHNFDIARIAQSCSISDPLSPWKLSAAIRGTRARAFWSPGFMPPARCPVPFVFTVHDLTHLHARGRFRSAYFHAVVRPLSRAAHRIATVSEFSRIEICAWTGLPAERVVVISNGVSAAYCPQGPRHAPGYPYLLYVGNHLPHKNLARVFKAFAASGCARDLRVLLTGDPNPELLQLAAGLGIAQHILFTGRVAETDLPAFYRGATALVLISTHEGFGLPVAEAMACGTPVLAANATSLPEIAGGAAVLTDPHRMEDISEGMRLIVYDTALRESCRARGLEQCRRFNWDRSAAQLSSVLAEIENPG